MTKPFDLKDLTAKLAAAGLPLAEETAELLVANVFDWLNESAAIHSSPIVQAAVPLAVATIKPIVAKELNKIDQDDNN